MAHSPVRSTTRVDIPPAGSPDPTLELAGQPNSWVHAVALQGHHIYIGGDYSHIGGESQHDVSRISREGRLDLTFVEQHYNFGAVHDIAVEGSGGLVVGGTHGLDRLSAGGDLDQGFRDRVQDIELEAVRAFHRYGGGKLLVLGRFKLRGQRHPEGGLIQLHPDGSIDKDFKIQQWGRTALGTAIAVDSAAGILVAVADLPQTVRRYDPYGNPWSGYRVETDNHVHTLAWMGHGHAVVGGAFTHVHGTHRPYLARLRRDGSLETRFLPATDHGPSGTVHNVARLHDGGVMVGGGFSRYSREERPFLARVSGGGELDRSFDARYLDQVPLQHFYDMAFEYDRRGRETFVTAVGDTRHDGGYLTRLYM